MSNDRIVALIVAGGRGNRAQTALPKQYMRVGGVPLLRRTILVFLNHTQIDGVQVVIGENDARHFTEATAGLEGLLTPVIGGKDRQGSAANGLRALKENAPDFVLIHDGARPFVAAATITAVIEALQKAPGAIAALPVADTLKRETLGHGIAKTISRDGLWRAQTPQGFHFRAILDAHKNARPGIATDDASLLEASGQHVMLIPDVPTNIKLTYKEDFALAEMLIAGQSETRTGMGVDVHAFEDGNAVILGGISIPHTHKLKGHSDADVALHAIADAIYGAMSDGDIGQHFPPSDEQWRGAASRVFVEHAAERLRALGGSIVNVDLTIICEAPKIGPHRDIIAQAIADMLDVAPARVSVKATTTEQLGFTGRGEGIMAQAIATIKVPLPS